MRTAGDGASFGHIGTRWCQRQSGMGVIQQPASPPCSPLPADPRSTLPLPGRDLSILSARFDTFPLASSALLCRALLELGPAACLARLPAALESLASLMQEGVGGALPFATTVPPLRARIIQVAAASPLLPWALQHTARPEQQPAQQAGGGQAEQTAGPAPVQQQEAATGEVLQQGPAADGEPDAQAAPESQAAQETAQQQQAPAVQQPPASPLAKPTPRQAAVAVVDGPAAAVKGGSARAAALLELLQELQMGCHLSGQRRQVALVAGSSESAAMLLGLVASAKELKMVEVCPLADAQQTAPGASLSGGPVGVGRSASLPSAGSVGRSASLGRAASMDAGGGGGGDGNPETNGGYAGGAVDAVGEERVGSAAAAAEAVPDGAEPTSDPEASGEGPSLSEAAAVAANSSDGDDAAGQSRPAGELVRSASDTEAAVAAAWAQAAPAVRVGKLVVHLLTPAELPALERSIAGYHSLVWCDRHGAKRRAAHRGSAALGAGPQHSTPAGQRPCTGRLRHRPPPLPCTLPLFAGTALGTCCMRPARSWSRPPWRPATACRRLLPPPTLRQAAGARGSAWSATCWPLPARCWRWEKCGGWTTRSRCAQGGACSPCLPARRSWQACSRRCRQLVTLTTLPAAPGTMAPHAMQAAMELVQLGDAAAEEKLTMLAHRNTAPALEPEVTPGDAHPESVLPRTVAAWRAAAACSAARAGMPATNVSNVSRSNR